MIKILKLKISNVSDVIILLLMSKIVYTLHVDYLLDEAYTFTLGYQLAAAFKSDIGYLLDVLYTWHNAYLLDLPKALDAAYLLHENLPQPSVPCHLRKANRPHSLLHLNQ